MLRFLFLFVATKATILATATPVYGFHFFDGDIENTCVCAHSISFLSKINVFQYEKKNWLPLVFSENKTQLLDELSLTVKTNFFPTSSFLSFIETENGKIEIRQRHGQLYAIDVRLVAHASFSFLERLSLVPKAEFHITQGETEFIPFLKYTGPISFFEEDGISYIRIPVYAQKRKTAIEILFPADRKISLKQFLRLRMSAREQHATVFLPRVDTTCSFDFLKNQETALVFYKIHETEPVVMVKCEEKSNVMLSEDGLSISSALDVSFRGIGAGSKSTTYLELIRVDRPFYFFVGATNFETKTFDGLYCGRISRPTR